MVYEMTYKKILEEGVPFNPFNMFIGINIPIGLVECPFVPSTVKILMGRLFLFSGRNGKAYPSRKTLAKACGCSVSAIDINIKKAKKLGLLITKPHKTTQSIKGQEVSEYLFPYSRLYDREYTAIENNSSTAIENNSSTAIENNSSTAIENNSSGETTIEINSSTTIENDRHKRINFEKNHLSKDKSLQHAAKSAACEKGGNVAIKKVRKRKRKIKSKSSNCTSSSNIAKHIVPTPDVSDRKANNKSCKSNSKIAKGEWKHTISDHQIYIKLLGLGSTKQIETKQSYFDTMDCIHELFNPNPKKYKSPLLRANNFEKGDDEDWINQIDFFADVFAYQMKFNKKSIKNIKQFIIFDVNINKEPWSPLLTWGARFMKGNDALSEKAKLLYKNLKKKIEKENNKHDIEAFEKLSIYNLNNAATFIDEVEKEYEFISDQIGIRPKIAMIHVFTNFILQKMISKGVTWKLGYISTEITQDDFIDIMVRGNTLKKKSKSKRNLSQRCDS